MEYHCKGYNRCDRHLYILFRNCISSIFLAVKHLLSLGSQHRGGQFVESPDIYSRQLEGQRKLKAW
jgi:hypothetical protein